MTALLTANSFFLMFCSIPAFERTSTRPDPVIVGLKILSFTYVCFSSFRACQGGVQCGLLFTRISTEAKMESTLLPDIWQKRVSCLVFDEVHCMSQWGEEFRPDYKEMAQLRSFFKESVLAVTATSTPKMKDDVISLLQLEEEKTVIISRSEDRPNIFISCQKKTTNEYKTELEWLIEHLRENGISSKKTIIHCRSVDTVSEIFISLKDAQGEYAYVDKTPNVDNLLIEMYHKCTHKTSKQRILNNFSKANSALRCIVDTVALGMGIGMGSSCSTYWLPEVRNFLLARSWAVRQRRPTRL